MIAGLPVEPCDKGDLITVWGVEAFVKVWAVNLNARLYVGAKAKAGYQAGEFSFRDLHVVLSPMVISAG
jgi:hypothetical protein